MITLCVLHAEAGHRPVDGLAVLGRVLAVPSVELRVPSGVKVAGFEVTVDVIRVNHDGRVGEDVGLGCILR